MVATTTTSTELVSDDTVLSTSAEVDDIESVEYTDDEVTYTFSDSSSITTSLDGTYTSATTYSSDGTTCFITTTYYGTNAATTV